MIFRCTFPRRYPATSPGHADPTARQGYYVEANSEDAAIFLVRMRHAENDTDVVDIQMCR